MEIICDDMGSLGINDKGEILGYGTETGAFVRLDDLQKGYAFSQLDRAIFMSPQKTNARALMPVAPIEKVLKGVPMDYLFYANNYEEVDSKHPIIEEINSPEDALAIFSEGARMSKGTTTEKGLSHTYFEIHLARLNLSKNTTSCLGSFSVNFFGTKSSSVSLELDWVFRGWKLKDRKRQQRIYWTW